MTVCKYTLTLNNTNSIGQSFQSSIEFNAASLNELRSLFSVYFDCGQSSNYIVEMSSNTPVGFWDAEDHDFEVISLIDHDGHDITSVFTTWRGNTVFDNIDR